MSAFSNDPSVDPIIQNKIHYCRVWFYYKAIFVSSNYNKEQKQMEQIKMKQNYYCEIDWMYSTLRVNWRHWLLICAALRWIVIYIYHTYITNCIVSTPFVSVHSSISALCKLQSTFKDVLTWTFQEIIWNRCCLNFKLLQVGKSFEQAKTLHSLQVCIKQ